MSEREFTAIESSEDLVSAAYLPKRTDIGLDTALEVTPYAGLSHTDSHDAMTKFFENEWTSKEQSGFEVIYDADEEQTRFNLLMDSYVNSEGQTLNHFADTEQASVGSGEAELFKNLGDDSYVAGGEVAFDKDYWMPILMNSNEMESDPLQPLISQMSQNGRSDVTTVLQVTSSPIEDEQWQKRFPIGAMVYRFYIGVMSVMFSMLYALLVAYKRGFGTAFVEMIQSWVEEVATVFSYLTGYSRKDYKKEFSYVADFETQGVREKAEQLQAETNPLETLFMLPIMPSIKGRGTTDDETFQQDLGEALDTVDKKARRHGDVVEMRVVAIGDDRSEVEKQLSQMKRLLEDTYTTPADDASVQQALRVESVMGRSELKQLLMDVGQRKTGVDFHGRVRNHYRAKFLHKNRRKPIVMSAPELATLIHMPSDEVSDRSIMYEQPQPSGNIPDKYE